LQVAIESSRLQSRTVCHLISEVEYDKCKHVTVVNSTKHGIESLAGVKEQVPSYSWRLVNAFGLAERSVPSAESQMAVCFRIPELERQVDRGAPVWGDKGTMRGIAGGVQMKHYTCAKVISNESLTRCRSHGLFKVLMLLYQLRCILERKTESEESVK
jgi:hypothetical protein